jgi:hypothetical protein
MKVSIVGLGRMGQNHLQACRSLGLDVVSICDPKISLADVSKLSPGSSLFGDVDSMIEKEVPDLGIIATTADSHFEIARKMIESGVKHILCEKPVVSNLDNGNTLLALVEDSNVRFAVNHQMRFMETYQIVKNLSTKFSLGELRAMTVSGSNIGLSMNGTHYFEAFSWLTNSRITRVTSWLDDEVLINPRGVNFKDNSGQVLCRNDKNQRLYLDIGVDLGHEIIVDYAFRNGHITVNELEGFGSVVARNLDSISEKTSRYGLPGINENFIFSTLSTAATSALTLSELISGGDYPDISDGIHSVSAAFAAINSHERGSIEVAIEDLKNFNNSQSWA